MINNYDILATELIRYYIAFEPELQRSIAVDVRYILFIIDKYARASHFIEEMTIVN